MHRTNCSQSGCDMSCSRGPTAPIVLPLCFDVPVEDGRYYRISPWEWGAARMASPRGTSGRVMQTSRSCLSQPTIASALSILSLKRAVATGEAQQQNSCGLAASISLCAVKPLFACPRSSKMHFRRSFNADEFLRCGWFGLQLGP